MQLGGGHNIVIKIQILNLILKHFLLILFSQVLLLYVINYLTHIFILLYVGGHQRTKLLLKLI